MAPKKKDEGPKERPILGRFKSNLKVSSLAQARAALAAAAPAAAAQKASICGQRESACARC